MLFNSPEYIFVFLPLVFLAFLIGARYFDRWVSKSILVLGSLFFYGYWNPIYLVLIIGSIVFNYVAGGLIRLEGHQPRRKAFLVLGIAVNLGLLGYFKYADFFLENAAAVLSLDIQPLELVLPLAISFFTFQQIAYLVEDYRGETPRYDFLDYVLFVTFFPQLIAGPIVRHEQIFPQLRSPRFGSVRLAEINQGLALFALGLFKKVVVADTFAKLANEGYASDAALGFLDSWAVSLSYTFQLYYDFSGYTDMAVGAALLFNIRLPINFDSPYKAVSIQDFWRRWHITLSNWLRDYLYIPLGGNRRGSARAFTNALITFLLGGLWHGAGWTFVLWGGLHGLAVGIHAIWARAGARLPTSIAWPMTFLFVNAAWVLFRAESMDDAARVYAGMIGLNGFGLSPEGASLLNSLAPNPLVTFRSDVASTMATLPDLEWIVIWGIIALLAPNSHQITGYTADERQAPRQPALKGLGIGIVAGIGITALLVSTGTEFLYFNF